MLHRIDCIAIIKHQTSITDPTDTSPNYLNPNEVIYEAESPDEAALVYAAKAYGVTLMERLATSVHIKWPNQDELIKIKVEVLYTKITAFAHHFGMNIDYII